MRIFVFHHSGTTQAQAWHANDPFATIIYGVCWVGWGMQWLGTNSTHWGENSRHTLGRTNHVTGLVNSRPVSFLIYTLHTIFKYKWFEISHKKDGCQISMLLWKPNLPWWVSLQKQSTCSTSPCSLGPFPRRHLWSLSFYDEHFLQFSLVLHLPVKD